MAQSDEWECVEEWYGPPPDEILEGTYKGKRTQNNITVGDMDMERECISGIKKKAKEHIAGVEEAVNSVDSVVRTWKDWQRKVLLGLCPECRNKFKPNDKTKPKKVCPTDTDKRQSSSFRSLLPGSGKKTSKIKEKKSSSVDKNGQESPEEMLSSINALQLLLEAKESAYLNSIKKTNCENEKLKNDIDKLNEENKLLQQRVSTVDMELEQAQKDTARVISDTENVNAEMTARSEQWETTRNGLTEQITDLTKQLTEKKIKIGGLENDLDTKDEELRMINKELTEAKRPRLRDIVLGLRTERSGMGKTMIEMVSRELSGQLQNLLDKDNVRLTVKQCTAAAEVPKGLLAVLCLDMSRVGTNIKDALAGIKVNRDVIVIVFHHTSKENLSSLTPTSLRITGSELRQLGAIIDMVFSSDGGIYECDLNTAAVANIASLLAKYS